MTHGARLDAFGGDILFIEATGNPGRSCILTGQLGEVMRESAQAALSVVKNRANSMGIDPARFAKLDIHIHVPAGATPKDKTSAGVAMFIALAPLLTGRSVRNDTAMTGEISLRGFVLPVGVVKEKVIVAQHAGIKPVMLPARNRRDLEDIPDETRRHLEFIWLEHVEDAVPLGLNFEGDSGIFANQFVGSSGRVDRLAVLASRFRAVVARLCTTSSACSRVRP